MGAEPFLGQVQVFAFNFAPRGWLFCDGQLISIAQNSAVFALLGTTFGGNGQTTFALPDLRGRVVIHPGTGPGLSTYQVGQVGGVENVTLLQSNMPSHTHAAQATVSLNVNNGAANVATPTAGLALAAAKDANGDSINLYTATAPNTALAGGTSAVTVSPTGNGTPFGNIQPYLAMYSCIAMEGIFPSRN